jgi:hypothetical protein
MLYKNKKLREKCCGEHSDIIKGRRMSDLESNIFHYWVDILYIIDEEGLNKVLKKYFK